MPFSDVWRLGESQDLTVASSGGGAVSTAAFGPQTYAVQLCYIAGATSTAGVRVAIGNLTEQPVAGSTSAFFPPFVPTIIKVTPGQQLSAISNDGVSRQLNIVQLTK